MSLKLNQISNRSKEILVEMKILNPKKTSKDLILMIAMASMDKTIEVISKHSKTGHREQHPLVIILKSQAKRANLWT